MSVSCTLFSATTLLLSQNAQNINKEGMAHGRSLIEDRPHVPTVLDLPRAMPRKDSQNSNSLKKYLKDSEEDIAQNPYLLSGHPLPSELPAIELLLRNTVVEKGGIGRDQ